MSPTRRIPALTRYFAVVSVLSMLALGVALWVTTETIMRDRALSEAIGSARDVESYARTRVPATAYSAGLVNPDDRAAVAVAVAGFDDRLVALRLWTPAGRLIYASRAADPVEPDRERLRRALRGDGSRTDHSLAVVEEDPGALGVRAPAHVRTVVDVYVPVHHGDERVGAAEVVLDYSTTQSALAVGVREVTAVIVTGLVLVWLLLFRTVRTFSRRLQDNAQENARLAYSDSLTGLPNRRLLAVRLDRAVAAAQADGTGVGLVLLDVDRFKDINDSLGHDLGDVLLEQIARRLEGVLRDDDVVARLGGDEFAILLPAIPSVDDARRLAERVRHEFVLPFTLGGLDLHVETSVGVACLPEHAHDASSLMRRADVAMYSAKAHRLGVAVYSPDEDDSSPARLVLLGDLHRALERPDEMLLHYQPKIDLVSGRTVGVEALMRWHHPTRGMLAPNLFIPLAEQTGLIVTLTRFALATAVRQIAQWRDEGVTLPVAVNLSAHNLTSLDVAEQIESLLATHHVPAALLQVEITETALVADPSRIVPVLERLESVGVRVAIDDFGIGNTSISQLRDLPVSQLKIDRLFVQDLAARGGKPGAELLVRAMVDLAHSFGLTVVAEGVEDEATARRLVDLDVDQAQGFLYSAAVPADAVAGVRVHALPTPRRSRPAGRPHPDGRPAASRSGSPAGP